MTWLRSPTAQWSQMATDDFVAMVATAQWAALASDDSQALTTAQWAALATDDVPRHRR
jgi:hypothetical protein